MLCLEPSVVNAVWRTIEDLIPEPPDPADHPLGCHKPRIDNRLCFDGLLWKLVAGVSWETIDQLGNVSSGTLKRRRTEWVDAGVFHELFDQAVAAYDLLTGYDTDDILVDGSTQKAPGGGEGTGKNPTDRGKTGYKWSLATDADGAPIAVVLDGANVPDYQLLDPTLEQVQARGLLVDGAKLRCDRGYDYPLTDQIMAERGLTDRVRRKRRKGDPKPVVREKLGKRWPVERTNAWLVNFGQVRRSTDRRLVCREAWVLLALALILVSKLVHAKHLRPAY